MASKQDVAFTVLEYALLIVMPVLYLCIFFTLSGDWYWTEGWYFMGMLMSMSFVVTLYLYFNDPALLKERMKMSSDDQDAEDTWLFKILAALFLAEFVIIPLDAKRFNWSESIIASISLFPWFKRIAFLLMIPGTGILIGSFMQCTFLSPILRIQSERGHEVVSHGLYSMMRHPMYSGCILSFGGGAIYCESVLAMITMVLVVIVLVLRVNAEEAMLVKGLKGYVAYREKVKYRFFPFIY